MGATHVINSSQTDAKLAILAISGTAGVDAFIDNTGQTAIIEMGYETTKPQGRVILVGVPSKGKNVNIFSLPLHFGKVLSGSHGGEAIPHTDIPRYHRLFQNGYPVKNPLPIFTNSIILMRLLTVRAGPFLGAV